MMYYVLFGIVFLSAIISVYNLIMLLQSYKDKENE